MESILTSIKKLLGIDEMYESFDPDIIIHINSALTILNQLGVGPPGGFYITDVNDRWADFIENDKTIEFVKSYVFMKVKLIFDPPQNSATIESYNRLISELEWRITAAVDSIDTTA